MITKGIKLIFQFLMGAPSLWGREENAFFPVLIVQI